MERIRYYSGVLVLLLLVFASCKKEDNDHSPDNGPKYSWTRIADFPGEARSDAVYMGTGILGIGSNFYFANSFYKLEYK